MVAIKVPLHRVLLAFGAALLLVSIPLQTVRADGDWVDFRQVGRFYVFAEFPIDRVQLVDVFIDGLPDHESDVRATLGLTRSTRPILIELHADRRSYRERLTDLAPDAVRRQAAFIRARSTDRLVGRVCVYNL